jgi:Coenzyme PQQ synthesis protein D (PqqD)
LRRPAVERRLGSDGVLLDLVGRAMYLLNPTALAVWELCDGGRTAEEVVAKLARRYRVPEATAAPGCLAALAFLEAAGLVVGANGDRSSAGGWRAASTSAGAPSVGAEG